MVLRGGVRAQTFAYRGFVKSGIYVGKFFVCPKVFGICIALLALRDFYDSGLFPTVVVAVATVREFEIALLSGRL